MKAPARASSFLVAALLVAGACSSAMGAAPLPSVTRAANQKSPTNVQPVRLSALFSEPVAGFAAEDVLLSRPAAVTVHETTPNDGTAFEIEISSLLEDGPLYASIPAGAATGLDGSPSLPSASSDPCVILDWTPPPAPDLAEPDDGAATSDLSPRLAWTAPDDETGIAKYRVEIRGPRARDYSTTRTTYTPTLGEQGTYTWRVSCLDGAGNTGSWAPWRSLVLDDSPPEPPAVDSWSPMPDAWTHAEAIDIAIAPATDAVSGLAGYAVAWDHNASTIPLGPPNRDSFWISETLAFPEDNPWWCHATAVDRAGNRSISFHAGPFCIDRTPPTLLGVTDALTLPNDPGRLFATADWSTVTVIDALDPCPTVGFSIPDGALLPLGRSDVVVTARDHAGNTLVRSIALEVTNTEAPIIDTVWPEEGARLLLGEMSRPAWSVKSLAPIEVVRTEGMVGTFLNTQVPGRHEFSVTVIDSTGLRATASVTYIVSYADRHLEFARIRMDATEEIIWPPLSTPLEVERPVFHFSESIGVRCRPDLPPEAVRRELPITFSLVRASRSTTKPPIVERVGVLEWDGALCEIDIALAGLRSGNYILWIGFVDGFSQSFEFRLAR